MIKSVLSSVKCVGGLQRLGEFVLTNTAIRMGGLLSCGESALTTAKRVGGLQRFGDLLDHRNVCSWVAEVGRVGFDNRKAFTRLTQLRRANFDHRKACRRLADVWKVRFYHRDACRRFREYILESLF